ncbi:MAG: PAS domain S-box protein [Nitrospiraceae bacterium]|nr:MAG: PAS domain S-box protein [Nitrospiraceae bacterium]
MSERATPANSKRDALRQGKGRARASVAKARGKDASESGHLQFERLISDLSARIVNIAPDQVDAEIERALEEVLEFFQVDRCALLGLSPDLKRVHVTHAAYAEGMERVSEDIDLAALFPWMYEKLVIQGQPVCLAKIEELPETAARDRGNYIAMGIRSLLDIPLFFGGRVSSIIVLNSLHQNRSWPEEFIHRLRLLGEILISAVERKRTDQALRENEARLSLATDAAGVMPWDLDMGSGRIWTTEQGKEFFGFATDSDMTLEGFLRIVHAEDREKLRLTVEETIRSGKDNKAQYRIMRPDGSIRWVLSRGRSYPAAPGSSSRLMGVSIDFTESKRVEEALEESQVQALAVVNSTDDFIWSVDPERFGLLTWNRAFRDYFFKRRGIEIAVGMIPAELVPPDYVVLWHELFCRALREGSFSTEYVVVARTNVLLLSFNLLKRRGEVFGISIFGRDITERKRVEEELRSSEERFRQIAESVSDFIWEVDAKGLFRYTSLAVEKILGYTPEELVGKMHFYDLIVPEVRRELKKAALKVFDAKGSFRAFPNPNVSKDGKIVYLETSGMPVLDEAGNLVGYRGADTDITERKRTEDALWESRHQLVEAQRIAHLGTWDWDMMSNELTWSEETYRIFGIQQDGFGASYEAFLEVVHPDDQEAVMKAVNEVLADPDKTYSIEYRIVMPDGVQRIVHGQGEVTFAADGSPVRMLGTVLDITERKKTEEALRQSKEFNQAVLMSLRDHIAVLDRQGVILVVNESWLKFAHENAAPVMELIGPGVNYLEVCRRSLNLGDNTALAALDGVNSVMKGQRLDFQMEYPCHSPAEERWFRMTVVPFKGEKGCVIITHTCITERKIAENSLAANESVLKKTQEVAHIAGWRFDILRNRVEWAAGLDTLLGIPPGLPLTYEDVLSMMHPDDRKIADAQWKAALENGGTYDSEHRFLVNGRLRWVRAKAEVDFDDAGQPIFATGIVQDITDRKLKAEQTHLLEEELTHVARVSALGEMTAAIAHEVNQPLAAIMSNAQVAQRMLNNERPDLPELREIITDIISDDRRAKEVIQRLRAMLKKTEFDHTLVNVNEIIGEVVSLMRSDLIIRGVWLNLDLDENIPPVYGDRVQLQQVVLNLILNACDAMQSSEDRDLTISTRQEDSGEVVVRVSDTGTGIPDKNFSELFHPFFTTKEEGIGMGLAINRAIISTHGGRIWAENNPGGGASFSFAVPASREGEQ